MVKLIDVFINILDQKNSNPLFLLSSSRAAGSSIPLPVSSSSSNVQAAPPSSSATTPLIIPGYHHYTSDSHSTRLNSNTNGNNLHANCGIKVSAASTTNSSAVAKNC